MKTSIVRQSPLTLETLSAQMVEYAAWARGVARSSEDYYEQDHYEDQAQESEKEAEELLELAESIYEDLERRASR